MLGISMENISLVSNVVLTVSFKIIRVSKKVATSQANVGLLNSLLQM